MLRKFRIYYNNNKHKIWAVIGIIIFIYVIIRLINFGIRKNKEQQNMIENLNSAETTYLPSSKQPVISEKKIDEEELEKDTEIINKFVQYGNEKNVEKAYDLLSQDCKKEVYKTIDEFYEKYFKKIFDQTRNYDLETWDTNQNKIVYKMKYLNNIMATGKIEEEYIEDYITVVKDNKEKKLNINKYIGKTVVEKTTEKENIKIEVINKYTYYDYEEYEIIVTNNNNQTIILDTKNKTDTVYVKCKNGKKYRWFGNSISDEHLKLESNENQKIKIKFNKDYDSNNNANLMYFTDVQFNNDNRKVEIMVKI